MTFYAPENFIYLWSLAIVFIISVLARRLWKKRLNQFAVPSIQLKLIPNYQASEKHFRLLLWFLILFLSVVALARPQWGETKRKVERKGVDIIFLMDTSLSMLAEDVKPNRFEKEKIEIKSILKRLKGDRIGMVAFAGSGFLQSPLTLDYSAFMLFLDAVKVGHIPDPGTSLDKALRLAIRAFPEQTAKHKAVILFTDGEDHEGGIETTLEEAKKASLRVYTIGTGLAQGEPIPLRDGQGRKSGFKKDRAGQVVMTRLNPELLEKIARETGGIYLPSTPGEQEIDILLKHMESLGKRQYKEKQVVEREDHYQIFLLFSLLGLFAEMFIRRTRRRLPVKNLGLVLVFFLAGSFFSNQTALAAENPIKLFNDKKYQSARDVYLKAKIKEPEDPAVRYNLGTTQYKLDEFGEASKELEETVAKVKDPKLKAKALYNYGNTQYRLGNFEKAIEAYKKALEIKSDDKDAKYNLEFLQKKKSMFDKKNENRQNPQKQNQKNQQNQQQNQQPQQQSQSKQQNQQNQQSQQQEQNNQQNQNQPQNQQPQQQHDPQQNQQQQQEEQDPQQSQSQSQQQKGQEDQKKDPSQDKDKEQEQNQQLPQPSDQEKQEKEQPSQQEERQQEGQQPQDQQEQQQQAGQDQSQQQEQQEQQDRESQERPGGQAPQPSPGPSQQRQGKRPLQGQMTLENALQILEALKDSEKDLQNLRRPGKTKPQQGEPDLPLKDW